MSGIESGNSSPLKVSLSNYFDVPLQRGFELAYAFETLKKRTFEGVYREVFTTVSKT